LPAVFGLPDDAVVRRTGQITSIKDTAAEIHRFLPSFMPPISKPFGYERTAKIETNVPFLENVWLYTEAK
jgi:hypothetical protein